MYRKYQSQFKSTVLTIFAGELYVSARQEILSTVLGSCIAVCLYDAKNRVGGMNHFMLPQETKHNIDRQWELKQESLTDQSLRYGMTSMEKLIAEMQKKGAERSQLKAKVFGGGNVLTRMSAGPSVGDKNIGFTRAYLRSEGIPIDVSDVGKDYGRKIFFLTSQNSVFVKKVALEAAEKEEEIYLKKLKEFKKEQDSVTLF